MKDFVGLVAWRRVESVVKKAELRYLEAMKHRTERNWSHYNQKLKSIARIDFFISEEAIEHWHYGGARKHGGKVLYSDHVIELCLLMREYFQLAYRQTQGFVESVFAAMQLDLQIPDYTTMSRRAGTLNVNIRKASSLINHHKEPIVVAIDSTGLSLYTRTEWNRRKHQNDKLPGHEKWRKLHVIINVETGEILDSRYTKSTANDAPELPSMLDAIPEEISAVCGDMAYDTVNCREAIKRKKARQLIPPKKQARVSTKNRNMKKHKETLQERDEAINYIEHNKINGDASLARKSWKEKSGYHARSLAETCMWQIKSHSSDDLSNKSEENRAVQAKIKCKIVNLVNAA